MIEHGFVQPHSLRVTLLRPGTTRLGFVAMTYLEDLADPRIPTLANLRARIETAVKTWVQSRPGKAALQAAGGRLTLCDLQHYYRKPELIELLALNGVFGLTIAEFRDVVPDWFPDDILVTAGPSHGKKSRQ